MQYIQTTTDDLKSGYSTYMLEYYKDKIRFSAYTGDTAIGANEQGLRVNAYQRGYFLRKGFSDAVINADPNILTPIYRDNEDKEVFPKSVTEAIKQIYESKLNISGFRFNKNATDAQKEEAFGKLINRFVFASRNLDFDSDKNLFFVMKGQARVIYNNGGDNNVRIRGVDVQERLGLKTPEVINERILREKMKACLRK